MQTAEIQRVLSRLHEAGISVIGLKGIALLERVYTHQGQRYMYDVDLLVSERDFLKAETVIQNLGYRFHNEGMGWTLPFARALMGQVPYHKGAMVVELHWHIVSNSWFRATTAFDLDGLWARAVPAEIAGAPALRLCPEDEVLHLCYHTAVHHGLAHPHGVRDLLGVLRVERDSLDWSVLAGRAREWRVSVAVWAALKVARGRMQEARGREQEARGRMQEARGRMQGARSKKQEEGSKKQEARNEQRATSNQRPATSDQQPTTHNLEDDLIPEAALVALRVPRWRQRLLRPFVRRAMAGQAALVSGRMRFLGVLLVDRVRDLPGVVLRGLFPGRRWLQLRYDLSPRQAFWRQFTYPLQVLARGIGALASAVIHNS